MGNPPISLPSTETPCNRNLGPSDLTLIAEILAEDEKLQIASGVQYFKRMEHPNWILECTGAAILVEHDSKLFLKIIGVSAKKLYLTVQIGEDFQMEGNSFFQTFPGKSSTVGLSFSSPEEAKRFQKKMTECLNNPSSPSIPSKPIQQPSNNLPIKLSILPTKNSLPTVAAKASTSPVIGTPNSPVPKKPTFAPPAPPVNKPTAPPPIPTHSHHEDQSNASPHLHSSPSQNYNTSIKSLEGGKDLGKDSGKISKKPSFFKGLSNKIGSKKQDPSDYLPISDPRNFVHSSTIGWNPSDGSFEIKNIPKEWKRLFEAAGISKRELRRKQTASVVMNCVLENSEPPPAAPSPPTPLPAPPPTFSYQDKKNVHNNNNGGGLDGLHPSEGLAAKLSDVMRDARTYLDEEEEEEGGHEEEEDWSDTD